MKIFMYTVNLANSYFLFIDSNFKSKGWLWSGCYPQCSQRKSTLGGVCFEKWSLSVEYLSTITVLAKQKLARDRGHPPVLHKDEEQYLVYWAVEKNKIGYRQTRRQNSSAKVTTYKSVCTQLGSQSCISFLPNAVPWYMYSQAFSSSINHTVISMFAVSSIPNLLYSSPHIWKWPIQDSITINCSTK